MMIKSHIIVFLICISLTLFIAQTPVFGNEKTVSVYFSRYLSGNSIPMNSSLHVQNYMAREDSNVTARKSLALTRVYSKRDNYCFSVARDIEENELTPDLLNTAAVGKSRQVHVLETWDCYIFAIGEQALEELTERLYHYLQENRYDLLYLQCTYLKYYTAPLTAFENGIFSIRLPGGYMDDYLNLSAIFSYLISYNETEGYLGFIGKTFGGIDRVAGFMQGLPDNPNRIFFSSGERLPQEHYSLDLTMKMLHDSGCSFFCPTHELAAASHQELNELQTRYPDVTILSSNLHRASSGDPLFQESAIKEIQGLKIGFIGLSRKMEEAGIAGVDPDVLAADYKDTVRRMVEGLKNKTDAVIAISNLNNEDNLKLKKPALGVEVIAGNIGGWEHGLNNGPEEITVTLPESSKYAEKRNYLLTDMFWGSVGQIDLTFRDDILRKIRFKPHILDITVPKDQDLKARNDTILKNFTRMDNEVLIPDLDTIYDDLAHKHWEQRYELFNARFYNLVTTIVHRTAQAEVTIVKQYQRTNFQIDYGDLIKTYVHAWLVNNTPIAVLELTGQELMTVRNRLLQYNREEARKYEAYCFQGITPDGKVNSLYVSPREPYLVAISDYALNNMFPHLSSKVLHKINVRDTVIQYLSNLRKTYAATEPDRYRREIKQLLDGVPEPGKAVRKFHIRQLSYNLTSTNAKNNSQYAGVPDQRLYVNDQTITVGNADLAYSYDYKNFNWTSGVRLDFARVEVSQAGRTFINDIDNTFVIETGVNKRLSRFRYPAMGRDLGLFLDISRNGVISDRNPFNSEFYRLTSGVKLYQGLLFDSFSLGGIVEENYRIDDHYTRYGLDLDFKMNKAFQEKNRWSMDLNYIHFWRGNTRLDLSDELIVKSQLVIPITRTLQLVPFVKAFFCKGEIADVTYSNITSGLAINFNRLYKYR